MSFLFLVYTLGTVLLGLSLPIFSYLTLIYRELGRMTTGPIHQHLEIFEAEIEPKLKINRHSGGRTFRIIGHFWLAFLVLETTRGVVYFVPGRWESFLEFIVFLTLEVVILMHFLPDMLLYRTTGRWLLPLLPLIRATMWLAWPVRIFLEGAESLARIAEHEPEQGELIEQVVEFSDKRVREVMTPRPDIVAIAAEATLEELHAKFVEHKFSKMPVYEKTLDDIFGVVNAQDLLHIADQDLPKRKVRELARPVLFIPETKAGSDLLREMRQKGQPLAVVIDEHGSVAGIATVEDLVEEIVGESGYDAKQPLADVVRETDGGLVMRGSMSIDDVEELLGVKFGDKSDAAVTTIAGLLSHVSGKVPEPGDKIDLEGHKFEVLEANQRKVLRVRIRKQVAAQAQLSHVRAPKR